MANRFRDRIETGFESWARIVIAHPLAILFASLAFAFICMAGLPRVYLDVTFEGFLGKSDEVRVAYEFFREEFGRDERIIIAIDRGDAAGAEGVFDFAFLERLREFHDAIKDRLPHLVEVTSLINSRDTRGEGDTLLVEDFLDPWPETAEDLAQRRERALANPLFRNVVISEDGRVTAMTLELELYSRVGAEEAELSGFDNPDAAGTSGKEAEPPPLLTGAETAESVAELRAVIAEFERPEFVIHAAGTPVMLQTVAGGMMRDMPRFMGLAVASIATLLFLLFRRVIAVVLPLLVVVLSVTATIGLMGWTGTPIHVPTQILPSFLLAVGVGDAVHLLSIFLERIRSGELRDEALVHALGHSGLALALTSITTAAGLASFASSGIEPIAMLGRLAPAGVMIALFMSLTLLPALLALAPLGSPSGHFVSDEENALDRLLVGFGRFATRNPVAILVGAIILTSIASVYASRMELSHNPLLWMSADSPLVQDTLFIDETMGGSFSFEVVLDSGSVGGVREPETLDRLAALGRSFEDEQRDGLSAGQSISLADVVREINQALNADDPAAYVIPENPLLVAQELLLFENTGTDDLEDLTDSQFERARMTVRMPWRDAVRYQVFFDMAQRDVASALEGLGDWRVTGVLALLVRSISAVVTSMAQSYLLAFAIITPIMVVLLGNLRMGLLAMIPNALPILLTLGVMGAFGFPLDTFSLMVGGIAIGLAVDDTIHFMHNYRRYRDQGMDLEAAVEATLLTAGRAMLVTTLVLSVGFLGFLMSSMVNLSNFGLLVAFAISAAFFADVLLAPALLALVDRRGPTPDSGGGAGAGGNTA